MPETPLWSAVLNHLCLETAEPESTRGFYRGALGMTETEIGTGQWLLEGPGRRILLSTGVSKTLGYSGFTVANHERLGMLHQHIVDQGGAVTDSPSPLLQQGAFAVRDPDGNTLCFGVERPTVVVLDGME